ncbi:hypothetical protein [Nonomuraea sp. NPDC049400]|uniref:hypothetical protein n=1 Tax=Nonomuraea sp. NPDC049400 TaxID=3364352 RepID=UPI0037B4A951
MSTPAAPAARPPITLNNFALDGEEQAVLGDVFASALYAAADDHDDDAYADRYHLMNRFAQFVSDLNPYQRRQSP